MECFELKPGDPIYEADGPPRMLCAEVWNGRAIMLRIDHPEECIEDLKARAAYMRLKRTTRNRKLDERYRK